MVEIFIFLDPRGSCLFRSQRNVTIILVFIVMLQKCARSTVITEMARELTLCQGISR